MEPTGPRPDLFADLSFPLRVHRPSSLAAPGMILWFLPTLRAFGRERVRAVLVRGLSGLFCSRLRFFLGTLLKDTA